MKEKHLILESGSIQEIVTEQNKVLEAHRGYSVAMKRWFLSSASQKSELPDEQGAVSYIVQPPLDGSAIALWLYLVAEVDVEYLPGETVAREEGREYRWKASMTAAGADSAEQTSGMLEKYEAELAGRGMSIEANCVRTWFFVNDIDNNYAGLVRARRENFIAQGLTPHTHYVASTGIAGESPFEGALVQMDAYSIKGDFSQSYLHAPTHLNPTYEYGVTFERGVKLSMGNHTRILISGTASIDNRGQVLHTGDVVAQSSRMMENIEVLLSEAGALWDDIRVAIVYLRNASDHEKIAPLFEERFPHTPYVITLAPVCRPDWLIEMECIAAIQSGD